MAISDVRVWDGSGWQSMKGPRGAQGDKGADSTVPGPKGDRGEPGVGERGRDGVGVETAKVLDGSLVLRMSDGTERVAGHVVGPRGGDGTNGRDGRDAAPAPPPIPGPMGAPGRDGKDGISREDFEKAVREARESALADLVKSMEVDGRTLTIGERSFELPVPIYHGVWKEGGEYQRGDFATRAGSVWHCNVTGTKDTPRDGQPGWTLAVKAGRDAREAVKVSTPLKNGA